MSSSNEDRWAREMAACGAVVLKSDPNLDPGDGDAMQLRLTYEGPVYSYSRQGEDIEVKRSKHKQEIRKKFHPQLKRWWETNKFLKESLPLVAEKKGATWRDHLAAEYLRAGYRFVPLVVEEIHLLCAIHVLFLRNGQPGDLISSGDIDNRVKTIVDALTMPERASQLGPYKTPDDGEDPFYVLLANDKLVSHLSVETDAMLEPVEGSYDLNNARVVVTATIKPYHVTLENLSFS
jgi:hypothetical protein